ncbi:branched-chain amino acid ABC transporter permease [Aquamicrobium sp. LC103]|uniref:branched-chain amino acid ABC transporter permease n=1 Tax=Aquamicrobium sp. LC103 TaxID=1120658 RepID=UPI00063EC692|nr:branched-chain amino acid ABC transporter permease [Aquamicrobium sp. LC103]TKT69515.1 branched-chain amino acid ABC transporter permease [Aquamicrobium sp. LC103]
MLILKRMFPVIALVVPLIIVVFVIDQFGTGNMQRVSTEALVRLVFAVGLYMFVGNSGILSFGHMTFCAVAAYASAWQTCCSMMKPTIMSGLPAFVRDNTFPLIPSALTSVGLAGAVALVSGLVLMRLSFFSASISTLALLVIMNVVFANWTTVTMGNSTIVGLPVYVTIWGALAATVVVIVLAYLFQNSRWGLMLRATREEEVAAQASGVSLYWSRFIAFTLSGFVAGLAGVLFAHFMGTVSLSNFFLNHTFIIVAMLVIGGMHSLAGVVVGVALISAVTEVLRQAEAGYSIGGLSFAVPPGTQELVLAVTMLLILIFRKDGIMGGKEFRWPWPARSDRLAIEERKVASVQRSS